MISKIDYLFQRILRIPRSRGYGVQSPFAYRFVREVLNRRYSLPELSCEENKLLKANGLNTKFLSLYKKLLLFQKPELVWFIGDNSQHFPLLLHTGIIDDSIIKSKETCQCGLDCSLEIYKLHVSDKLSKAKQTLSEDELPNKFDFASVPADLLDTRLIDYLMNHVKVSSMLFVTNIHVSRKACQHWQKLVDDDRVVISFDLYNHGIAFFDHTKSKQNFKVNYK